MGKVEEMQKAYVIAPPSSTLVGAAANNPDPKSLKPPSLPPFSGAEPVPKDEASCEQWVWQAREALKTCTLGAVRTTIIQSVRGEVREFVSSVGFETSVEELLDKIQEQFGEHWTADRLKQEFYQLTQGKTEKVQQYARRLEAKFKRLRDKIPGMYERSILKERLFHGMHQDL